MIQDVLQAQEEDNKGEIKMPQMLGPERRREMNKES